MNMSSDESAISVNHLSVKFDDFYAVQDLSFSVERGEIFGFLGANGAGKTTTIRVLCGLLYPTAGEVMVSGILFNNVETEQEIKRKVGYMSQKFTLYEDLTIEENLNFISTLRKLNPKFYGARKKFLLDFINFKKPMNTLVKDLSGGVKQQVSLAASLLHDPDIIFLDEPTAGVSPKMRECFWALIHNLSELNKTVFVTTHYMDEVEQCGRVALMRSGAIVAMDTPANLKTQAFSNPIFECVAKQKIDYLEITKLRLHSEFEFFEPFGLKFHATFKKTDAAEKFRKELNGLFDMKQIKPTMEDVFIKIIEGRTV